jgi:hypothetical protein
MSKNVFGYVGLLLALPLFVAAEAEAIGGRDLGFGFRLEPIIGFEHVQKLAPSPHVKNRLIYGARIIGGTPRLAGELEYTRGTDRELYPESDLSITETADRGKLGLRSGYDLGEIFRFHLRAGGQLSRVRRDRTQGGVTSRDWDEPDLSPYAGAGISVRLADALDASAELVVVVRDFGDLSQNEYQTTAGFQVRVP